MRQRLSLIVVVLLLTSVVFLPVQADELPPAVVPGASKSAATRLDEAAQRLAEARKQADPRALAEAADLLRAVAENSSNDLVVLPDGRSIRAGWLAQRTLARLNTRELASYRRKVEPQAEKWLQEATRTGDEELLRRVASEAFCSRSAQAALTQLGDRAFAAGRFDEADGWWRLLAPLDPADDDLRYPDPSEELAVRTQAKQVLVHLFAGRSGWQEELAAFAKRHPKASGRLAGGVGTYAKLLQEMADRRKHQLAVPATTWPTFGGDPSRGCVEGAPPHVLERLSQLCRGGATWRFDLAKRTPWVGAASEIKTGQEAAAARSLAFHPVVVGRYALIADARYVTAYDLHTGKVETWYDARDNVGGINPRLELPAPADLRYTLTVAEGCVYARLGSQTVRDVRPDPRQIDRPGGLLPDTRESILVCLAVKPEADGDRRRWMVPAINIDRKEYAVFEGAPLVADGRVYIAATRFDGDKVITAIHCYPAHPEDSSPALLWRTDVCETRELLPAGTEASPTATMRTRQHLLTLAGSRVVYCSHSGAVVALDRRTGRRDWALKYPRRQIREPEDEPGLRDLAPCLFADGRLYVAPADSEFLYCLDPANGSTVWKRERLDAVHLLGVGRGKLIFTTWRNPRQGKIRAGGLRAVGADDGSDAAGWLLPDDGGGLAPFGRGLLLGDLVLWPTVRKPYGVFAVRQQDGEQSDNPALLHQIPSGNLVYANGCLLVADRFTLHAFVPPELLPAEVARTRSASAAPPAAWARLRNLVRQTRALRAAHKVQEAARTWQVVLQDDRLRDMIVEEQGLPQSASQVREFADLVRREPPAPLTNSTLPPPSVSGPLWQACAATLDRGEVFLAPDSAAGASAERVWSASRGALVCRSRQGGEVMWRKRLPFDPAWLAGRGNLVLAGGAGGAAALRVEDGERVWTFLAPPLGGYPSEADGPIRVICNVAPPEPLADFHLLGDRLVCVQGGRRLLALEGRSGRTLWQRWAPGAGFAMPAPRGHYQGVFPLSADLLLVQASGRRWLLDAAGKIRHASTAPLERWPRSPLRVDDDRVCLVVDANTVELLDVRSGQTQWTHTPPGKTTRSGEPPLVVGNALALFVLIPENIGYRLQRLDVRDGKPLWDRPPLLGLDALEAPAWLAGTRFLYHADANELTARSLKDGSRAWRRPLLGDGVWQLEQAGDVLLVWPARGATARFQFRWLTGSLQWRVGSVPVSAAVELLDAQSGLPVQRIVLEEALLPGAVWLEKQPARVCPSVQVWREADSASGLNVWRDGQGLVAGLGNQVKVLAAEKHTK